MREREPRAGLVRAAEREQALADLLEDVSVGLAGRVELGRELALDREGLVEAPERAQAARHRPAGDRARGRVGLGAPRRQRALEPRERRLRIAGVVVGPAEVVRERPDPAAGIRVARGLGEPERPLVPRHCCPSSSETIAIMCAASTASPS